MIDLTAAKSEVFKSIEDALIEWRDARLSVLPAANGLVVCERDGTPSSIIRMTTRTAVNRIVDLAAPLIGEAIAQAIEANLAEHALCDVEFDAGYQFASEVAATIAREVTR